MKYRGYLLFSDDIKIVRVANSVEDCTLLQSEIECAREFCTANFIKLNISKTRAIAVTRKTSVLFCPHQICDSSVTLYGHYQRPRGTT
jgi:hypothetical protein